MYNEGTPIAQGGEAINEAHGIRPPLPRAYYDRPTVEVARDLIGCVLAHASAEGLTAGVIVETEAYVAAVDPAAHGYGGPTPRTAVMFGPPGHAYIYRSYGVHACLNAVTEPAGLAAAVLIRAVRPLCGIELMRTRRGPGIADRDLARGPGRLCAAMGITLAMNGADLTGGTLWIAPPHDGSATGTIVTTPRIGISKAVTLPWRFVLAGSRYISGRVIGG